MDLVLNSRVSSIDVPRKQVQLEHGNTVAFGALLLATGADPVKLPVPGASPSQVHYLRTFDDSRALVLKASSAKQVVIAGASFIALEVAASLRARDIAIHIVAPDKCHSNVYLVVRYVILCNNFTNPTTWCSTRARRSLGLMDGKQRSVAVQSLADFLVLRVGVRSSLALAEQAGSKLNRGLQVSEYLETSVPGIFAAGDVARWPDRHSGQLLRIEHWVIAERQGQVAA